MMTKMRTIIDIERGLSLEYIRTIKTVGDLKSLSKKMLEDYFNEYGK